MSKSLDNLDGYSEWIAELKIFISQTQQNMSLAVNRGLVLLYWKIGKEILARQTEQGWGAKVIQHIADDLKTAFPDMRGFSARNLTYMRTFAERWTDDDIVKNIAAKLPWYHLCSLMDKERDIASANWYMHKAIEHGWSRAVLIHQIENRLIEREGKAITNFAETLPPIVSELAQQTLKDPYIFDFLNLGAEAKERDLEKALTEKISQFLLELGAGFAFVGKQVHLEVGGDDFYIDLLFYHLKMHCYIVIELKTTEFKPEHIGQLNFYLAAVDNQIKTNSDKPTIGLLLCKSKNRLVAEYALRNNTQPIGVAEYQLGQALPKEFAEQLPSIEELENKLNTSGLI